MAIDLKKMREKQSKQENKGKTVDKNFWKPVKDVVNTVRLVPTEDGDPLKEKFFHYLKDTINGKEETKTVFCPKKNLGENCAICDLVSKLYKGTEEDRKFAKSILAKQRFYSPVIVRGEEEKGVQVWGYPVTIYNGLISLILNPEYGDITDVDEGLDLDVTIKQEKGKMYPEPSFVPKRKASKLSKFNEQTSEWLNHGIDFDSLFEQKTSGQVAEILDEFLNGGGDEGGEVSDTADNSRKETSTSEGDSEVVDLDAALKGLGV